MHETTAAPRSRGGRSEAVRAWILGSGGGIGTPRRGTCSALVREGAHAVLIDAGTGVANLIAQPHLLAGVERFDVVLTHFHLDHVVGLAYLPSLPLPASRCVHGPGRALYDTSTRTILTRLLTHPFLARGWDLSAITAEIGEIGPGSFALGTLTISARAQRLHSDPTLALRVDHDLAYCTDTSYDVTNLQFAQGCRVLAHEAWYAGPAPPGMAGHSSAAEAARIAQGAAVERLVMIHINPSANERALGDEASALFANAVVATDLMQIA